MSDLLALLTPPVAPVERAAAVVDAWAARLARRLLSESVLVAGPVRARVREVELYLSAPYHPDPFAHASRWQASRGRWYFHRMGDSYRGGTFKGLDLTCGSSDPTARSFGGVLIRSLEGPEGLVDGSCNCVDALLRWTGHATVAALDAAIGAAAAVDPASPLRLEPADAPVSEALYGTARVGLTLKRAGDHPTMPAYIGRRLRFLSRPRAIKKGRPYLIAALHSAGHDADAIRALTGSPRRSIERAVAAFDAGAAARDLSRFVGAAPKAAELCHLLGAWFGVHGDAGRVSAM